MVDDQQSFERQLLYERVRRRLQNPRAQWIIAPGESYEWSDILDAWSEPGQEELRRERVPYTIDDTDPEGWEPGWITSHLSLIEYPYWIQLAILYHTFDLALSCLTENMLNNPTIRFAVEGDDLELIARDLKAEIQRWISFLPDTDTRNIFGWHNRTASEAAQAQDLYSEIYAIILAVHNIELEEPLNNPLRPVQSLLGTIYTAWHYGANFPIDPANRFLRSSLPLDMARIIELTHRALIFIAYCSGRLSGEFMMGVLEEWDVAAWGPEEIIREDMYGNEIVTVRSREEEVENLYANWWYLMSQRLPFIVT